MAEVTNNNVFDANKKFVDLTGLDYFWAKAKSYIDGVDAELSGKISTLETTVGDSNSGLVKEVAALRSEMNALGGSEGGSIQDMIDSSIAELKISDYAKKTDVATDIATAKQEAIDAAAADATSKANTAEGNAKSYTNTALESYTTTVDMNSAIATAKQEAIDAANGYTNTALESYTTTVDMNSAIATAKQEAITHANGLDEAMDTRVKVLEAIDHQKIVDDAINDFATKVSNDEVVNTFKELVDYAAANGAQVGTLIADVAKKADKTYVDGLDEAMDTRVKVLEAIDHQGLIDTALESYTTTVNMNSAIATAKQEAIDAANGYTDTALESYTTTVNMNSAIATAKQEAIDAAAADATSKADAAKAGALSEAKTYVNTQLESYTTTTDMNAAIEAAKNAAIADAAEKLKNYYTKSEIDTKLSENTAADQAYARAYTDALFNSFQFAVSTDIDKLFEGKKA